MTAPTTSLWVVLLAVGCASAPAQQETPRVSSLQQELAGAPPWVLSSCAKYLKRKVACGVGSSGATRIQQLLQNAAQQAGRVTIARNLEGDGEELPRQHHRDGRGDKG